MGCAVQDIGSASRPYSYWECPATLEVADGAPSPEVSQSLLEFGSTWAGSFLLVNADSGEQHDVPAQVIFDYGNAELAEHASPNDPECTGSVYAFWVPGELHFLDWVGSFTAWMHVVTAERSGWDGGYRERWEHNVHLHGGVNAWNVRGDPELNLYRALMGIEPPAELEDVVVRASDLRGGMAYVAFEVGEAEVPRKLDGTAHLEPVPEQ